MSHKGDHQSPTRMEEGARRSCDLSGDCSGRLCASGKVSLLMRRQVLHGIEAMGQIHNQWSCGSGVQLDCGFVSHSVSEDCQVSVPIVGMRKSLLLDACRSNATSARRSSGKPWRFLLVECWSQRCPWKGSGGEVLPRDMLRLSV